jgi:hypothetical protein
MVGRSFSGTLLVVIGIVLLLLSLGDSLRQRGGLRRTP